MKLPKVKITGLRGSWNADAGPFGVLTCVHHYWWRDLNLYHDTQARLEGWMTVDGLLPHSEKAYEQHRKLEAEGLCIVTDDEVTTDPETGLVMPGGFKRKTPNGYLGIWEVDLPLYLDDKGFYFRFGRQVAEVA